MPRHRAIVVYGQYSLHNRRGIIVQIPEVSHEEALSCFMLCNSLNTDTHIKYLLLKGRVLEQRARQFDTAKGKKGTTYIAGYVHVPKTMYNISVELNPTRE